MYIESFSRKVLPGGGYGGYDVIIVGDDGKKHGVLAFPREHAGKNAIHSAAYAALSKAAVAQQKATIDKAAEIMQQIEEQKEAERLASEEDRTPEEMPETEEPPEKTIEKPADLSGMKYFELRAYAKERGVKVTKKSKKKDLLTALEKLSEQTIEKE